MSEWIADEEGNLTNISHIERIYATNRRESEVISYDKKRVSVVTFTIKASMNSGKIVILGDATKQPLLGADDIFLQSLFTSFLREEKRVACFIDLVRFWNYELEKKDVYLDQLVDCNSSIIVIDNEYSPEEAKRVKSEIAQERRNKKLDEIEAEETKEALKRESPTTEESNEK